MKLLLLISVPRAKRGLLASLFLPVIFPQTFYISFVLFGDDDGNWNISLITGHHLIFTSLHSASVSLLIYSSQTILESGKDLY